MAQDWHSFAMAHQPSDINADTAARQGFRPNPAKLLELLPKKQVTYVEPGIFLEFTIDTIISSKLEPQAADWNAVVIAG